MKGPIVGAVSVFHTHIGFAFARVVLLSLASAASYGIAAVLQHRATTVQPSHLSMRPGLLVRLAGDPMWILGNGMDVVGYVLQFLALRQGSLPLVEPLLVSSLVFAIPISARLDHRRVSAAEIAAATVIAVGLALFMGAANPGAGHPFASGWDWVILTAVVIATCAAMALGARHASRQHAALLLAGGSGIAFGYVAALTEHTGHVLDGGALHTLTTWSPYALVVAAGVALLLTQSAFHAGALRLSLPTLTVVQPLVGIAIGLGIFGEHVNSRGLAPILETIGLLLAILGVFGLAQSPVIASEQSDN